MVQNALMRAGTDVTGHRDMISALEAAGLAHWDVTKVPMYAHVGEDDLRHDSETFKTVATVGGESKLLGTVGKQYTPVQNEAHAGFLDEIVAQSGGEYATATAFKGGKLVYVSVKLPEGVKVGGVDPVNMYLNGINSHDGTTNFMLNLSPERAWCANQLSYFRRNSLKFKHSGNITDKVIKAQESLNLTFDFIGQFTEHANRLAGVDLTAGQLSKLTEEVFPPPPKIGQSRESLSRGERNANTRYEQLRDGIAATTHSATNRDVEGTVWGGMNAVIEYLQWEHGSEAKRNERIMTSTALENKIKQVCNVFSEVALAS